MHILKAFETDFQSALQKGCTDLHRGKSALKKKKKKINSSKIRVVKILQRFFSFLYFVQLNSPFPHLLTTLVCVCITHLKIFE